MARYYVNKNKDNDGDNEVHIDGCAWLEMAMETEFLGDFTSCLPAVDEARSRGYDADGCEHCSEDCHAR